MASSFLAAAGGAGVFTPDGFAVAFREFGESLNGSILRALRRVSEVPKLFAVDLFRSRGVGRGIFGAKAKGAMKLIKTSVRGPIAGRFLLSMELRGFAALQEQGGHTKPPRHGGLIVPATKQALKLKVPSLGVIVRGSVKHPGANIPRHPFATKALQKASPRILSEIDVSICTFRAAGVPMATTSSRAA